MRNLYKGIVSAAIIGASYFGNPGSVYSQTLASTQFGVPKQKADTVQTQKDTTKKVPQIKTVENRIMMRNPASTFSATGRGISLTNYVYDITLTPDSKYNLDSAFVAVRGDLSYSASDIRESIQYELKDLKNEKPQTPKSIASRKYLERLLRNTPKSDQASLNLIKRAVQDGYVDVAGDSLFVNGQWRIKPGLYTIVAETEKTTTVGKTKYVKNSLPTPARIGFQTQTVAPYDSAAARIERERTDSAEKRNRAVSDSLEREGTRLKDLQEKLRSDSTALAQADRARKPLAYQPRKEAPKKPRTHSRLQTELGLEGAVGTNSELVVGGFASRQLNNTLSVGGYLDVYLTGNPIRESTVSDTLSRESQLEPPLIGPGTYKVRTDYITKEKEDKAKAEVGLELSLRSGDWLFPVRAGLVLAGREESKEGFSVIEHWRNQKLLEKPSVIRNSMEGDSKNVLKLSLSTGVLYRVNENVDLGLTGNLAGEKLSGRLNLRYHINLK